MSPNEDTLINWLFLGVAISGLLLIMAIFMKCSKGLFLARTISQFKDDEKDPQYERERTVGKVVSNYLLTYVPPIFFGLVILLILKTLNWL